MIDFNKDVMPLKNKLYRLALRVVQNHDEAQDITQETLIRLWKRSESLPDAAEAEALGITMCHNLALDALGRAGRNHEQLDGIAEITAHDSAASPLETLSQDDRRQMLIRQINLLPERQRAIVQLRDIEGLSYKEIAEALQVSEEQIKITLFRARQTLRQACQNTEKYGL